MPPRNRKVLYHLVLPTIPAIIFLINAALPKTVLGCANRGWVALAIAALSGLAALITVGMALKTRIVNNPSSYWWMGSTLILIIPLIAFLYLA